MTYIAHEISGGYYEIYKRVNATRRLHYMPYAQAGWIDWTERDTLHPCYTLYSYSSEILTIIDMCDGTLVIDIAAATAVINYSRTTSKQVTMALREYMRDDIAQAVKIALTKTDATRVLVDASGVMALDGSEQGVYLYNRV